MYKLLGLRLHLQVGAAQVVYTFRHLQRTTAGVKRRGSWVHNPSADYQLRAVLVAKLE